MIVLTEGQERALRPLIDEVPGRRARMPSYPAKRARGSVTLPNGQKIAAPAPLTASSPPAVRIFPFYFSYIASTRRSFSLGRCAGPGIIKDFCYWDTSGQTPPNLTLEIGWATSPVKENSVALTTPRPYTPLTEFQDPFAAVPNAGQGYPRHTVPTNASKTTLPLDIGITASEFYPVIASVNNSALAADISGFMRVVENAAPGSTPF